MNAKLLIICAIAIVAVVFSTVLFLENNSTFSENDTEIKNDAKLLDEINMQAAIQKNNGNEEKFREQTALMEETIGQIASDSLKMNVAKVIVDLSDPKTGIESRNFPFRDSSEIKIPKGDEPFPICNIPEEIPAHLKKFLDEPIFAMFSKKYSQYPTELLIIDERGFKSGIHYTVTAASNDGFFTASTTLHGNTCTDEIMEDVDYLLCTNVENDEMHQSFNQDDIVASLQLDEFCVIPLDPWRQSIYEFGKKMSEKRFESIDAFFESDNPEDIQKDWDEDEKLDLLRGIAHRIVNDGIESEITEKRIKEYNEKFGSLPDELLELIGNR